MYIDYLCRKTKNYDYQKRYIKKLSLILILAFGLIIGLFIAVIGIFASDIAAIDNYTKHNDAHVIHFSA
jgi:uncharacterized membrane protein